jgi:hypothetical protein
VEVSISDFDDFLHICSGRETKKPRISSFLDLQWLRNEPLKFLAPRPTYKIESVVTFLILKISNVIREVKNEYFYIN